MRTIEDVRTALDEVADTARLDSGVLETALTRGRTQRRRRTIAIAGGTAVAAALAIAVPMMIANPTRSPSDGIVATAGPELDSGPIAVPYAVGNLVTDDDTTFEAPGTVVGLAAAGGRYAVAWTTDDDSGTRLSITGPDGALQPTDVLLDTSGLVAGAAAGVPVVAAGGSTVSLVDLASGATKQLPTPGAVIGITSDGVVYAASDLSSSLGAPTVWDGVGAPRPLLADAVVTRAIGHGVAVVFDPATGCTSAIGVANPATPLWRECDTTGLRAYTPGLLSPDGARLVTGSTVLDARTGATISTLDVAEFAVTKANPHGSINAVWESPTRLLVGGAVTTTSHVDAIYRCDAMSGRCAALDEDHATAGVVFAGGGGT